MNYVKQSFIDIRAYTDSCDLISEESRRLSNNLLIFWTIRRHVV